MQFATEIIEVLMSGFVLFLAIFFLILKLLGVTNLDFLDYFGDYSTVISLLVAGSSYLLGVMIHRILIVIIPIFLLPLKRLFRKTYKNQSINELDDKYEKIVTLWQYGSERLHHSIEAHTRWLVLFRSMTVVLPLFGISFLIWSIDTYLVTYGWIVFSLAIILGSLNYILYRYQMRYYLRVINAAYAEMDAVKKRQKKTP
jgi:hypothetical protein